VLTTEPPTTSTPPQPSPSGIEVGILAIIAGIVLARERKFPG
jgi:hypothetical protein